MEAGTAANNGGGGGGGGGERKRRKYAAHAEAHQFEPIAVETMVVYGESTGLKINRHENQFHFQWEEIDFRLEEIDFQ